MIIGIAGKKGSGKDLCAHLMQTFLISEWETKKFAEPMKLAVSVMLGVDRNELEDRTYKESYVEELGMTVREFMNKFGTEVCRNINENIWVNILFRDYKDENWIITDVRKKNEVDAIESRGGIVIYIDRPGIEGGSHSTENELNDIDFNYVIHNDGTITDFWSKIKQTLRDSEKKLNMKLVKNRAYILSMENQQGFFVTLEQWNNSIDEKIFTTDCIKGYWAKDGKISSVNAWTSPSDDANEVFCININ